LLSSCRADSEYRDLILADTTNGGVADLSGNKLLEAPPYSVTLAFDPVLVEPR